MGLPTGIVANVTVNIWQLSNPAAPVPTGPPTVANVQGYLAPYMPNGRFGAAQWLKWTHILTLPIGTDVRDAYNSQLDPARNNNQADTVVVTDSNGVKVPYYCLLYTSPSPRDRTRSRMPSSA